MNYRIEKDHLGEKSLPVDSYWGIHTERSRENFNLSNSVVSIRLVKALAIVKKAASLTNAELGFLDKVISSAINQACDDIFEGRLSSAFPLDALQGGAGTSTNMNVNEVIANRALEILGYEKGQYDTIHPIEHVNMHQSTNDVYPTGLRIAAIYALRELSAEITLLQGALQQKEKEFAHILTIGRTEMQDAVPITLGSQFSSFAEAIARDRWRTFKSEERLRVVNIGGTAVGTGLTAPRKYIFLVIEKLRELAGLGLSRAEQVMDATANADVFVEISAILKANAVNLMKIAMDLRLLHYFGEIHLPAMQTGSSIMPGKINPVVAEATIIASMKVQSLDKLISDAASLGTLQINELLPLIAHSLLESLDILINTNKMLASTVQKITSDEKTCRRRFDSNVIIITAFLPVIGYNRAEELASEFELNANNNFKEFLVEKLGSEIVEKTLSTQNLMSLGYR